MALLLGNEIKRLANGVPINTFSATAQAVYTAPVSRQVVVTAVVLRCSAATAVTVGATAKVEINPGAGDIFASEVLIDVLTVDDTWVFVAESRGLVVPAGAQVDVTISTPATGTSQTLLADVIGYFIY